MGGSALKLYLCVSLPDLGKPFVFSGSVTMPLLLIMSKTSLLMMMTAKDYTVSFLPNMTSHVKKSTCLLPRDLATI